MLWPAPAPAIRADVDQLRRRRELASTWWCCDAGKAASSNWRGAAGTALCAAGGPGRRRSARTSPSCAAGAGWPALGGAAAPAKQHRGAERARQPPRGVLQARPVAQALVRAVAQLRRRRGLASTWWCRGASQPQLLPLATVYRGALYLKRSAQPPGTLPNALQMSVAAPRLSNNSIACWWPP
jgi:hypothetical protein